MAKNAVGDWSTTPDDNSDIAGINITENCPAQGINNAIRTLMAQIATWATSGFLSLTGGAMTGNITAMGAGSTVKDPGGTERLLGYRNLPLRAATSAQTLALGDVGQIISITTGGISVPTNAAVAFAVGDAVTIYNNSASSQSIAAVTPGTTTLRLAGTSTTGARTLALRGMCTLVKVATDEWVCSGAGLT